MSFKSLTRRNKFQRISALLVPFIVIGAIWVTLFTPSSPAQAAVGINPQMSFQGRLLTASGAVVPDGAYNLQFKLYTGGTGCVAGGTSPCGGTNVWTEDWVYGSGAPDNRVVLRNGYFSVSLGALTSLTGVDFNNDTLWTSINIGNTTTAATFGVASGDGQMLPFKRLTSSPYSFNAGKLGGLAASAYVQLTPAGQQTGSINVSGNIQTAAALQGATATLSSAGSLTVGTASSATGSIAFKSAGSANTVTVVSGVTSSSYQLTLPSALGGVAGDCLKDTTGAGVLGFGACGTLQAAYTAGVGGVVPAIKLDATRGELSIQDANTTIAGNLLSVRASNGAGLGATLLAVTSTGITTFKNTTDSTSAFVIRDSGNFPVINVDTTNAYVGIGTIAPASILHLKDPSTAAYLTVEGASDTDNYATLELRNTTGDSKWQFSNKSLTGVTKSFEIDHFNGTSWITPFSITDTGNVGVNMANATANLQVAGTTLLKGTSSTAFQVQNSSGNTIFGVDTSTAATLFGKASTIDGKLVVYNASNTNTISIVTGVTSASYSIILPTAAATAGQCLKSNATTPSQLEWGSCGGSGGVTRTVKLVPEYTGGVFQADGSANAGSMTSDSVKGLTLGQGYKHNYYEWSTANSSAQDYDIVVNSQIPAEYASGLGALKIWTYSTNTTNATVTIQMEDVDGTVCYGAPVAITPSTTSTWEQKTVGALTGCSFAASDIVTVTVHVIASNSAVLRIGEFEYQYTN